MALRQLKGAAKLQDVTQLLDTLKQDIQKKQLISAQRVQSLLQLRQHGTSPDNAEPIYSSDGIGILARYGVEGETVNERRAALRCIANALLLDESMRQVFVDTGYAGKLAEVLKTNNSEDEMITSRILFLSTYNTDLDYKNLIDNHSLADNVNYQLARHAKQFSEPGRQSLPQIDELALTDTLKLVFNISKIHSHVTFAFSPSIPDIFQIINHIVIPQNPLEGLLSALINSLSVLDIEGGMGKYFEKSTLFPDSDPNCNVESLVKILDQAIFVYGPRELEEKAIPILHSLIILRGLAPDGPRERMDALLLPEDKDRSQPIGNTDALASHLLKLSTGHCENLKVAISELMFVLCDKDPETLTKRIGYGYAAGFLASRGLEMPKNSSESDGLDSELNPVTGQRWAAEPKDTGPPMTNEEKEREAERLFVLFERARANGILTMENPVAQAVREGRFEELSDDADSD
ncbi:hypothetical protein N7495_006815 [Penicillium taxi]|uniref:uncharacterized protein n=1 Tax=Penicillium taxi TaxID=168475 RepID=UPI0025459CE9|nr:uncharacterized protein N7495_006815 [Penicillium taxi]KAJ5895124.1 hypothetical protein N7495_006815 [Penicillium taxi]